MYKKDKDSVFKMAGSRMIPAVYMSLLGLSALCVLFGPFVMLAKAVFAAVWFVLTDRARAIFRLVLAS